MPIFQCFYRARGVLRCALYLALVLLVVACRGNAARDERLTVESPIVTATPRPQTLPTRTPMFMGGTATPLNPAQPTSIVAVPTPFVVQPTPLVILPPTVFVPPTAFIPPTPFVQLPPTVIATVVLPDSGDGAAPVQDGYYQLLIARRGEDSLFVVNIGMADFPVRQLWLGGEDGAIEGRDWGIRRLERGDCVTAWKDGRNPRSPSVDCNQVGERIEREGRERFWKSAFEVYYDGQWVATCTSEICPVDIIVQ